MVLTGGGAVSAALKRVGARAIDVLRRPGHRTVILVSPDVNLGNFLYLWMRAFTEQAQGRDVTVEHTPRMDYWLPHFPYVADRLLVERSAVGFLDRRDLRAFQGWGTDYFPTHIEPFVRGALLPPGAAPQPEPGNPHRVVVNIRRGDFFGSTYAHRYSFNTLAYLRAALERSRALGGPIHTLHVVSDDLDWCRDHLPQLVEDDAVELTFPPDSRTPADDFWTLARARRLILTTSTFGYWGAHVSNVLHGDNHELVVVPWFHDRTIWDGECYMLNPSWTVVRSISGGWGPEPLPTATPAP